MLTWGEQPHLACGPLGASAQSRLPQLTEHPKELGLSRRKDIDASSHWQRGPADTPGQSQADGAGQKQAAGDMTLGARCALELVVGSRIPVQSPPRPGLLPGGCL